MTILEDLSKNENPEVAKEAAAQLRFKNIQREPLPLAFTALGWHPFDLAQQRGKVVLVYFWGAHSARAYAAAGHHGDLRKVSRARLRGRRHLSRREPRPDAHFREREEPELAALFDGKGPRNAISSSYAVRARADARGW